MEKKATKDLIEEKVYLGWMMLDDSVLTNAINKGVTPNEFSYPPHQMVFSAIFQLKLENRPVDLVTVANRLKEVGDLANIGGAMGLVILTQMAELYDGLIRLNNDFDNKAEDYGYGKDNSHD